MSIIAPVTTSLHALAEVTLAGHLVIRAARMEPDLRYKIDVSDPARRVVYVNRDRSPADLADGLIDACDRLRRHDREQRRSAMRVVEGGSAAGATDVRPSLRVLAGGAG